MMVTKNARDSILGDERIVAPGIRLILSDMHEHLPDGAYEDLTKAQQTVIDAGIYLNMHRLAQAERILEELTADPATAQWAQTTIWCIHQVAAFHGASIADYENALKNYLKPPFPPQERVAPINVKVKSPFRNWRSLWQWTRRCLTVLGVRTALAAGYVIVLVGPCRSGKSYIMERVLSGRIISKRKSAFDIGGDFVALTPGDIVPGRFGVDDVELIHPVTLAAAMSNSSAPYVLALQPQHQLGAQIQDVIAQRKHIVLTLVC